MNQLIVHTAPKSPIAEAYRGIRTNLMFADVDKAVKTILVTSATLGEGKTTTICNLAMTLGDSGKRVVLIDCDLRRPRLHKFMNVSNQKGVTDLLLHQDDYQNFVHKDLHKNVHIITSGRIPTNPSELLNSLAMKQLLKKLSQDYDYVLLDTPPVVPVTDTVIMSTYIDRIILVCASGKVDVEVVKKAKATLEKVGGNIMGVVLNKVPLKGKKYQNYYYYTPESEV